MQLPELECTNPVVDFDVEPYPEKQPTVIVVLANQCTTGSLVDESSFPNRALV